MKKKSILFQAKAKLAKMLKLEFESIETSDGKTLYVDGEIVEKAAIYELTDSGEYIPAANGTYTTDEMTIVVKAGAIVSVSTGEEGEEGEEEKKPAKKEEKKSGKKEEKFEDSPEPNQVSEAAGDVVLPEEYNELVKVVNGIMTEMGNLQKEVTRLADELKKASGTSTGTPAPQDKFNRRTKEINFADQKMKKLIQNFK